MLQQIQKALMAEARLKLRQFNGAKTPIEIAERFARYDQTVTILRRLGDMAYPKNNASASALNQETGKHVDRMEEDEILTDD